MGDQATDASGLPRLEVFDEEFEPESRPTLPQHRRRLSRRAVIGCGLGAVIISLPALAWLNADALPPEGPSAPMVLQSASWEDPDRQVSRLTDEIAALKRELGELARAHQEAVERISLLQSDQASWSSPVLSYWYSDLSALSFESATHPRPSALAPPPRRSVTVRSEARELRRRDNAEPLSLEAPQ